MSSTFPYSYQGNEHSGMENGDHKFHHQLQQQNTPPPLPVYNVNNYGDIQNLSNAMSLNPSYSQSFQHRPNVNVFEVRFKCTKGDFILPDSIQVQRGDFVKVEADRGYDIGIIFEKKPVSMGMSIPNKRILGHISAEEMAILPQKIGEETQAVQICRQMAALRGLVITIADVEFQFDRNKLTVIFASEGRVDFRELVRDMFAFFRIRIWMQKVSPSEAVVLMELAASDGISHDPDNSGTSVNNGNGSGGDSMINYSEPVNVPSSHRHNKVSYDGASGMDMFGMGPASSKRPNSFQRIESENSYSSGRSSPTLYSNTGSDSPPPLTSGYTRSNRNSPPPGPNVHLSPSHQPNQQSFF